MEIRTTCPSNNKYYIRSVTGGLNGAVAGDPTIKGANVLCNCVGYANGRFNEIWNDPELEGIVKSFNVQLTCNAENFIESAKRQGLKISSTPIEGGIMVWQKGSTLSGGDGAGHVAVVERVYDDGTIMTSESGWASWAFKTVRRDNTNGRWGQNTTYRFRGCIINPSIKDPKVVPVPPLVVDGIGGDCTVRAMQRFFGTPQDGVISGQNKTLNKFYPSLKAVEYGTGGSPCVKNLQRWVGTTQDGIIGEQTVKAWQKKIGVASDGIFGVNSMKAWQKYLNEHDKATYPAEDDTLLRKEMDACVAQAEWMKNYKYQWESYPTVPKSKYRGTCVTYVACVLQRIGILPSGDYVWHDEKGKVYGNNNKMTVIYPGNVTLAGYKNNLKAGDIVMVGDKYDPGAGSHILIINGVWQGDNPVVWDNHSAERRKKGYWGNYAYSGKRKIIAVIRLK